MILLAFAGALVLLSGCSSDDGGGDATGSTAEPTSSTVPAGPQPAEILDDGVVLRVMPPATTAE
jgi:hypothetical protein